MDRPRGNVRIIRGSEQSSADKHGSVRTWVKMGIDCWILAVTLPLRLYPMVCHFVTHIHATFSIPTYIFEAVTKLAQLHKWLQDTSGFRNFPHESVQNSCLDSSTWYRAEISSASMQISVNARTGQVIHVKYRMCNYNRLYIVSLRSWTWYIAKCFSM